MASFGVDLESVWLVVRNKGADEGGAVGEMDVFVAEAVIEVETAAFVGEVGGKLANVAFVVAIGIVLRRAHVALRVSRIVGLPQRDGREGVRKAKHVRLFGQGKQSHVAA